MVAPRLGIVLLAAGRAQRLGRCKPLVPLRGRTLLAGALAALALVGGPVRVVVPPRSPRLRAAVRAAGAIPVTNPERERGLSTSIRRGLRASREAGAVLFVPVDLPALERRELARLVRCWQGAPRRLIARRLGPDSGGIPLILPRWLFGRARTLRADQGLKALLPAVGVAERRLIALPSAAADLDTPAELARARRCWRPPAR